MKILHLNLFGPLQIRDAQGHPLYLGMRKEEALLAYLAVEHHHAHSRDNLHNLLWPDSTLDKGRLSLRVTLSRMKKRLKGVDTDALFDITSSDIQFRIEKCQVDAIEFTQGLQSGNRHNHRRNELCDRCQPAFAHAVSLYKGPFLDGLFVEGCHLFDEWLFMQRERFRLQMLDALDKLAHFHLQHGDNDSALAYARRQLEIDPLREGAHQMIMQIHFDQGERISALQQFERCRTLLRNELGVEPSAEMSELHRRILVISSSGVQAVASSDRADDASASYLPTYLTPFVGRNQEMSLLQESIADGKSRLITLVGAGGMGKTRLAVEAARQAVAHFADGAYFVSFAAVEDVATVIDTLAAVLGITFRGDERTPLAQLIGWLRPRHLLLVIDNFEHLLPAAPLLLEILQAARRVMMLVTSREPLGVQAEDRIRVTGLPIPAADQLEEAGRFPAVRLFADHAYRVDKSFQLRADNVADVVQICHLVEGRPLAIELAAWHTASRSCRLIAESIRADLDFLAADLPDLPARHRSLRAVFEQSWRALTSGSKLLWAAFALSQPLPRRSGHCCGWRLPADPHPALPCPSDRTS